MHATAPIFFRARPLHQPPLLPPLTAPTSASSASRRCSLRMKGRCTGHPCTPHGLGPRAWQAPQDGPAAAHDNGDGACCRGDEAATDEILREPVHAHRLGAARGRRSMPGYFVGEAPFTSSTASSATQSPCTQTHTASRRPLYRVAERSEMRSCALRACSACTSSPLFNCHPLRCTFTTGL